MTLQELLQARAENIQAQRTLLDTAKNDNDRDFTEEEASQFTEFENDLAELDKKIEAKKQQEEREKTLTAREKDLETQNQAFRPQMPTSHETQPDAKDDKGFNNLGEFLHAVRFGDPKGRLAEVPTGEGEGGGYQVPDAFKHLLVHNEMSSGTGAKGGFMVPEQFRSDILKMNAEKMIVRPRANVIEAGDPPDGKLTMPALDQGSTNGVYGGVQVQWIAEGDLKPETDANLREVSLDPHEVAAHTVVTDKLLRNWKAASSFLGNLLRGAMDSAEDIAFLGGDGVGKPTGVTSGAGALAVNRTTAGEITYDDVVAMYAKLLPESDAMWIANQSTLPQIVKLKDPANNYIFIQGDATRGIPSTLLGIPIKFTGKTKALGTKGDLQLIDFGYYLIKDGSGPFVSASEHVLFRQNKTVIKAFWNVDGKPWVISPLTLEDGATQVSPYVTLDIPAV